MYEDMCDFILEKKYISLSNNLTQNVERNSNSVKHANDAGFAA